MDLPELSDLAWGILDTACGPTGYVDWHRCAAGPRDALVAAGAVTQAVQIPAAPKKMGRGGKAAVYKLQPTEKGRLMLATWKASRG